MGGFRCGGACAIGPGGDFFRSSAGAQASVASVAKGLPLAPLPAAVPMAAVPVVAVSVGVVPVATLKQQWLLQPETAPTLLERVPFWLP